MGENRMQLCRVRSAREVRLNHLKMVHPALSMRLIGRTMGLTFRVNSPYVAYPAVHPPSTESVWQLIIFASSLARNTTAAAISSTSASFPAESYPIQTSGIPRSAVFSIIIGATCWAIKKSSFDVRIVVFVPVFLCHLQPRHGTIDSRVVDKNINAA